jgi:uncharacterized membrane protein YoaK (UPF0700 family)
VLNLAVATRDNARQLVADPKHGRLPVLLVMLTVVTGLVDAVSILKLGRVFVANMTGNVVFIGFAVAGAPGFSLSASLIALGGFLVGAAAVRPVLRRYGSVPTKLLAVAAAIEVLLILAASIVAAASSRPLPGAGKDTIAGLLALAMGSQNATARRLAVPDLTTTVLTMALTGVAADVRNGSGQAMTRRLLSVATMFSGAVVGAALVLHGHMTIALTIAAGVVLLVTGGAATAKGEPGLPSPTSDSKSRA